METLALGQPELRGAAAARARPRSSSSRRCACWSGSIPAAGRSGKFVHPSEEVVRFAVNPDTAFPASEIQSLDLDDGSRPRMGVNFMGLTGPEGVLPYCYSLLVSERIRERDTAASRFPRHLPPPDHLAVLSGLGEVPVRGLLRAGPAGSADATPEGPGGPRRARAAGPASASGTTPCCSTPGCSARSQRSAAALEQLIEDYFGVPAEVEQFVGGWYPLSASTECTLGDEGDPPSSSAGARSRGKRSGTRRRGCACASVHSPGASTTTSCRSGARTSPLRTLTRFFCGDQFDFEVQLVLARDEVPPSILGGDGRDRRSAGVPGCDRSRSRAMRTTRF